MYAILLSSRAQGQGVYVEKAGDCDDWVDREKLLSLYVNDAV